ncbi:MAG: glycosyltransferase [Flavobacteriales bacterium]|nr:glycosyltransferase [Flavobacteriales bacterium]
MAWLSDIIFIALLGIIIIELLLVFLLRHWPTKCEKHSATTTPSISVVVCSHNDANELKKNLPLLLNQNYLLFEVILVDDHSEDDTEVWLNTLSSKKLRVITLRNKKKTGKSNALAAGLRIASGEWIVLTDADCSVQSEDWLRHLSCYLTNQYIGYVAYGPHIKLRGFLNKLIRYDTAQVASLYLSSAAGGFPYMGVGRNMGWHRSVLSKVIDALEKLPTMSGDDDWVLQQLRNEGKIRPIADPTTFAFSLPKTSLKSWFRQKTRHHTTGWNYAWKDKLWLAAWHINRMLFYPLLLMFLLFGISSFQCIGIFLIRSVIVWGWQTIRFNKLLEKDLIFYIPLLEIIHTFVVLVFSLRSIGKANQSWK